MTMMASTLRTLTTMTTSTRCPTQRTARNSFLPTLSSVLFHKPQTFKPCFDASSSSSSSRTRRSLSSSSSSSSASSSSSQLHRKTNPNNRKRRLDVALVGAPNAGKSQLLNVLTQAPIAAVSRKRHTTRTGDILGVRTVVNHDTDDNGNSYDTHSIAKAGTTTTTTTTQIVFKDTPGYLRIENAKEERLDSSILQTAAVEMQDVDFTLLVIDAARKLTETYEHALVQLMIGALHSQGRIEDDIDDDDDDDDDYEFDSEEDYYNSNSTDDDEDLLIPRNSSPIETVAATAGPKFAVVLNKVDLVKDKEQLIPFAEHIGTIADACLQDYYGPSIMDDTERLLKVVPITFYVSALDEDGTDDILDYLVDMATPCQSWAVPLGQTTNQTTEEQICEVIREKIYRCTHREVPHSVEQVNRICEIRRRKTKKPTGSTSSKEQIDNENVGIPNGTGTGTGAGTGRFWNEDDVMVIQQDLIVFTKSHQRLVQGNGGRTLERIQETAQRDLKTLFKCDVVLSLKVKLNKSKQRRHAGE